MLNKSISLLQEKNKTLENMTYRDEEGATIMRNLLFQTDFWGMSVCICTLAYTAISRRVVGKNVHATIPKGNLGYDQYTVPDTVAVKTSSAAFL